MSRPVISATEVGRGGKVGMLAFPDGGDVLEGGHAGLPSMLAVPLGTLTLDHHNAPCAGQVRSGGVLSVA